jgi:hypothetical protein
MRKLAIFVEGLTEQSFVERLLAAVAGGKHLCIEKRKATGGVLSRRRLCLLDAGAAGASPKYFILIVDCGSDNRVKSDIRDRYDSLVSSGYEAIVGIRDVYPEFRFEEVPRLRRGMMYSMKRSPGEVLFVLSIMEIESWFIAEYTHFERIDQSLSPARIAASLNIDVVNEDLQRRPHPAADLNSIYNIAGLAYGKSRTRIQRTLGALDYARVYLDLGTRFGDLQELLNRIDNFFSA